MKRINYLETGTKQLIAKIEDNVLTIILNRPEAKNALSENLTPHLRTLLKKANNMNNLRLLILRGSGNAFCSGGDIKSMNNSNNGTNVSKKQKIKDLIKKQEKLTGALYSLRIPSIAVLTGPAAGAGFSLALACDFRIASSNAFVVSGYSNIGLSGDYGISWLLSNIIGTSKTKEIMFSNQRIYAYEAKKIGIFNTVFEEDFDRNVESFSKVIINSSPIAISLIKKNINFSIISSFNDSLEMEAKSLIESLESNDHKEAVKAFINKRKPSFKGY